MSEAAPRGAPDEGNTGAAMRAGPSDDSRAAVVETLLASWPKTDAGATARRRILSEVRRFREGQGASLPYATPDCVLWVTVGPSAADLRREIDRLRAWVLPSFGWEDPRQPFVVPGESGGRLAAQLLAASPAGYFRWRCAHGDYHVVADRLARMRALIARRPEHLYERVPSLLELRQQFRLALVTGAREAADAAIRSIDHHQLDSALNTHLMRVRLLDRFGEYTAIVDDPAVDRLLGLRLPQAARTALLRAFHAVLVAPREPEGVEIAAAAYRDRMHPAVGGLLALATPEDGPEIARSLAYRAWATDDAGQAAAVLPSADPAVAALLRPFADRLNAAAPVEDAQRLTDAFQQALRRNDLRALQALAPSLLAGLRGALPSTGASEGVRPADPVSALRDSLEVLPNPGLADQLALVGDGPMVSPAMPQSWSELVARLRAGDIVAAERFLALDEVDRPSPERLSAHEREAALASLEEFLTDPAFSTGGRARWVAEVALPAFIEDFVSEPRFPRTELTTLYLQLLRLWSEHKRGSASAPDGQLLLVLASAILRHAGGHEHEVAGHLVEWWQVRPVRASLPFLLEALDLVLDLTAGDGAAQQLWLDGATLAARAGETMSLTERALWRRLGRRAGFDATAVDDVLPEPLTAPGQEQTDSVRGLRLTKIAIVSLHRRAADEARDVLAERTGARVFVVDETVAGPGTRSAQTADAILFVWAATKHAVFRAFDAVRDRVIYVQGSGAGSIVLALERWAANRQAG